MDLVASIGASALITALGTAVFSVGASTAGLRLRRGALMVAGRRALLVTAALTTVAICTLAYALLVNDFSIEHVASVSSRNMEPLMKWASLYSGQPGSLLFWTWSLSVFLAAFALITLPKMPWGAPHATATAGLLLAVFLVALVFFASPFRVSPVTPPDGKGLNPLLVDGGMLVHPPFLLSGLVSTAVPFTLGAAALLAGRLDGAWIRHARGWALLSFLVLSIGNFLGGWWAYTVLGWGGYWGWDPVETSAILPLLPMTGFLHALMVQERRGMLKLWSIVLVLAAFALAVFGTFNVRSGLVASVHSFARSEIGPYFLVLVALTVVASLGLIVWRLPRLRADAELDALASRETGLILNSYVMVAMALVILGGTLFPVFSELVRGVRITVGPPFYNDVVGPLLVVLLAMTAIGVALPWRGASLRFIGRRLLLPTVGSVAVTTVAVALGMRHVGAVAGTSSAALVLLVSVHEYAIGARGAARARRTWFLPAFTGLFDRDPRRYGGYLVHIGFAVMAIAVIGSTIYQSRTRAVVRPGEQFTAGGYTFIYDGLAGRAPGVNGIETEVVTSLRVERDGRPITTMEPGRRFFTNFPEQPVAIVATDTSLTRDLYLFVQGWDENERAEIHAYVNPLVAWLWLGGGIYTAGGLLAFGPVRRPRPALAVMPEAAAGAS